MYLPYYFDPTYFLLIPGLLLAMYAQMKVQSAYQRYSKVDSDNGAAGRQVAQALMAAKGIYDVDIVMGKGQMTDHYDPTKKRLVLSPGVYQGSSLAALAIAAHETGHAMQHNEGYVPLAIRSFMAPGVQFASAAALPLFFIGLFFSFTLTQIGVYLFAAVVLFQLVTLPVEFDASSRALRALEEQGFVTEREYGGAKKVLSAAALTYVAAVAVSLLQLLRLLAISGMGRRRS
jgi:Zn-dependent membrane protease YugP